MNCALVQPPITVAVTVTVTVTVTVPVTVTVRVRVRGGRINATLPVESSVGNKIQVF